MRVTCPKSKEHKKFLTSVHVVEEWIVDERGKLIERVKMIQVDEGPDREGLWVCETCGEIANVE